MTSDSVDAEQLRRAFARIAQAMKARSEELRKLDAACGDGDLGVTVTKGFDAIERRLDELQGDPPARLLKTLGMTFNSAAASTFGVLLATGFIHAGNAIEGKSRIEAGDLCDMLRCAATGIQSRGHADLGDRTLLDALIPASAAAGAASGNGLKAALGAACEAAAHGAEATRSLVPKVGRARWLSDQATGTEDAGAVFVRFFLEACLDTLMETTEGG